MLPKVPVATLCLKTKGVLNLCIEISNCYRALGDFVFSSKLSSLAEINLFMYKQFSMSTVDLKKLG